MSCCLQKLLIIWSVIDGKLGLTSSSSSFCDFCNFLRLVGFLIFNTNTPRLCLHRCFSVFSIVLLRTWLSSLNKLMAQAKLLPNPSQSLTWYYKSLKNITKDFLEKKLIRFKMSSYYLSRIYAYKLQFCTHFRSYQVSPET